MRKIENRLYRTEYYKGYNEGFRSGLNSNRKTFKDILDYIGEYEDTVTVPARSVIMAIKQVIKEKVKYV